MEFNQSTKPIKVKEESMNILAHSKSDTQKETMKKLDG